MPSVSFASSSIHSFIHNVGADCGIAAILGIALVVVLYFAHARETANLRDALEDAHDRIDALDMRVQQLIGQQQSTRAPQPPAGVAPAPPVAARPMGSAVASLRQSAPATAVAAPAPAAASSLLPAASDGLGAPNLGSATKLIPDPAAASAVPNPFPARAADPGATAVVPPAGSDETVVGQPAVGAATVAAGLVGGAGAANGAAAGAPGRVHIRPGQGGAAAQGGVPRRTVPLNNGRQQPGKPLIQERSLLRRLLPILVGLVIVAAVVVALLKLTSGPATTKSTVTHTRKGHAHKSKTPPFNPAGYRVSVLNGTAVDGLAAAVSTVIDKKGYRPGPITNAATQTQQKTIVYYVKSSDKTAAEHVAQALTLPKSQVQAATQTALQSCATNTSGATSTCGAGVIVSVGADRAGLSPSGTVTG